MKNDNKKIIEFSSSWFEKCLEDYQYCLMLEEPDRQQTFWEYFTNRKQTYSKVMQKLLIERMKE